MIYGRTIGAQCDGYGHWCLRWQCPGCGTYHWLPAGRGEQHQWNGNPLEPTIYGRVQVELTEPDYVFCNCVIADGKITYRSDTTHALKGKTVPLPIWPYGAD